VAGSADPSQQAYDFLFETSSIDFVKSSMLGGEGDFDSAETAKEKETKVRVLNRTTTQPPPLYISARHTLAPPLLFAHPPPPQARAAKAESERERIQLDRAALPVYPYREEFLKAVEEHQIVIIVAETGAGKWPWSSSYC
jgi:hypothetical protein